jgi:hypothetical protein
MTAQIKREWKITFDEEKFIADAGGSLAKLLQRPGVRADWDAALDDARALVAPAALWDTFPIREFRHERLILADGTRIGNGPVAEVTAGATDLVVAVVTAGPAISGRVSMLQHEGARLRTMFLDDFGSWAVDQVRQGLCRYVEADTSARDWHASAALSPGESAWHVEEQAVIFGLLDTEPIGVTLTSSLVMTPVKSLSLIIGIGPEPLGSEGGSNCDYCTIRERCAYRHRRE